MNNQDYEFDVFISYRRDGWKDWVRNFLREDLELCLRDELGESKVFVDDGMEQTGTLWPEELKDALASSRVILPVLSTAYFHSHWCRTELAIMIERERLCNLRQRGNRRGIILPVRVADGEHFPENVRMLEPAKWHDFANPRIAADSPTRERLYNEVRQLALRLKDLIRSAPKFDASWRDIDEASYNCHYKECCVDPAAIKSTPPRL